MTAELTAVFRRVSSGYIAFVKELPGANTQGVTLEEARENLREAVQLVLEANKALRLQREGVWDRIERLRARMAERDSDWTDDEISADVKEARLGPCEVRLR